MTQRKSPRSKDAECGSVFEKPSQYRHLCILPQGHPGRHACWKVDCATWTERQASPGYGSKAAIR